MSKAKPFFIPPTLVARQALTALYYSALIGWGKLPHWLSKGRRTLHTAAGAVGMGCIGFPIHPVWEVTTACNLRCIHCHASGGKPSLGELSTVEGKKLISEIASIPEFRMLVFSGGEPLVRPDIVELTRYATSLGLEVSIATNGTLLTPSLAKRLKEARAGNIAVGLDGASPEVHEFIRGAGSFDLAIRGLYNAKEAGFALQLNITVMKPNLQEIPKLLDLADKLDVDIVLLYFFVSEGRGKLHEHLEVNITEYAQLLSYVAEQQKGMKPIVEPTCAPQYWPYLLQRSSLGRRTRRLGEVFFKGCVAGSGLCYIKSNGEVWPCPFIPFSGGNVKELCWLTT